jgi:serine/threonine-protein kinase RsbT
MAATIRENETLVIRSDADIYAAVGQGHLMAERMGFEQGDQTRVETIIAELVRNALMHGGGGYVTLRRVEQHGMSPAHLPKADTLVGLEVVVEDGGPGIADLALALADGYSSTGGLGMGIPAVRRLADEFNIDSVPGQGTRVRAIKWLRQVG